MALSSSLFDEYLLSEDRDLDQMVAHLVIIVLHELAHRKKTKWYAKGKFKVMTPPEFDFESGNFVDKLLCGLVGKKPYIGKMTKEMAAKVLDLSNWEKIPFLEEYEKQIPSEPKLKGELLKKAAYIHPNPGYCCHPVWNFEERTERDKKMKEWKKKFLEEAKAGETIEKK